MQSVRADKRKFPATALEITYKGGLLELSYLPRVTQMQIFRRMNPKKQGDTAYRFDRAAADTSAEAKAALKIVDHLADA